MKKLLALAALSCALSSPAVFAADAAYAQNKAGGYITLTDDHSNCDPGTLYYYVTDQNGNKLDRGCWSYGKPWINATAYNGQHYRWAVDGFEFTAYGLTMYGK